LDPGKRAPSTVGLDPHSLKVERDKAREVFQCLHVASIPTGDVCNVAAPHSRARFWIRFLDPNLDDERVCVGLKNIHADAI
jgi:hypothetical protein